MDFPLKVFGAIAIEIALFALLLFGAAGTLAWTEGWIFLGLLLIGSVATAWMLARRNPELLKERMRLAPREGQASWDRALLAAITIVFPLWLLTMGLDARGGGSDMPVWLQWVGGGGMILALWAWYVIFQENAFATAVVRIQRERGHQVVSSGPYGIVRHPLYTSGILFFVSAALLLGSWRGLIGAAILSALLVLRTALEDRTLTRELAGYAAYAKRVRYRLVPFVW